MDGLDTYIDDYGKPDPIPPSMLRQMSQSKFLGLFDDEDEPRRRRRQPRRRRGIPDGAAPAAVAQSSHRTAPAVRRPAPMTTLICDCNKTMPLDGPAPGAGPRA